MEDVKSDTVLRSSVDNIITLALEGNHLCRLIAKHGGVRSLLTICVDPKRRNVRVNAFRALGMYCIPFIIQIIITPTVCSMTSVVEYQYRVYKIR